MADDNYKAETKEIAARLGEAIRLAREAKGLGQVKVGDSGNLSRLEQGTQWTSLERLVQISKLTDVPLWRLFAYAEGAMNSTDWNLLVVYNNSNDDGKDLIDKNVQLAKRHYQKPAQDEKRPNIIHDASRTNRKR